MSTEAQPSAVNRNPRSVGVRPAFLLGNSRAGRPHYWAFVQAFAALQMVLTGCSYHQTGDAPDPNSNYQWRSLYREDVKSVAVPIFANKDFNRGVEFSLTEAIVKQIEARTPYKVMPRERADTVLEGEVVSVIRSVVSNDALAAIPQEQLYIVRVNFVWKDIRSGRILCERKNFEQTAVYYPTLGEGRFVGQQQNAEKLAAGIVQELQADW